VTHLQTFRKTINKYIIKYLLIVIFLTLAGIFLKASFPELYYNTLNDNGISKQRISFFGCYDFYLFNLILAVFIFFDLKKLKLNTFYIPILAVVSQFAGLFFFALYLANHIIDIKNGKD
jgi:hypothetical protein